MVDDAVYQHLHLRYQHLHLSSLVISASPVNSPSPKKLNMMYVIMLANGLSSMDESTHAELRTIALIIAACFVLVALILSSVLIVQHLKFYTNPEEQKWIVGVLLMVPIYASESILSLWQPKFVLIGSNGRYPYVAFVINFSQMWALYCLVKFYYVTHERLKPIRPLAKFISFKAIVFATWWQGVGIALLCYLNVLPKQGRFQTELQDFLICIEMAIAAVAHVFVFSAKAYHFLPASKYGQVSTSTIKEFVKVEEGDEDKPVVIEKTETQVEAPGTSVTESVQEIVVEGGQHVVDDVKMTLNQAYKHVGKGMTKIQETIHHLSVGDDDKKSEIEVNKYEKDVNKIGPDGSGEDNEKIKVRVEK